MKDSLINEINTGIRFPLLLLAIGVCIWVLSR